MPIRLEDESLLGQAEKILIYGEYGTGKTELWATAPEPIYALIAGPKNELKTLQSPGFRSRHGKRDITFDYIQEERGRRGVFKSALAFDKGCDLLDNALNERAKGNMPFNTLVIENATTFLDLQVNKVLEISRGSEESKTLQKLRQQNILYLGDGDYGGVQSLMWQLVNWIYNENIHVVFVAHEHVQTVQDRKTKKDEILAIRPNFIGKQRKDIPGLFDNVWRTSVQGAGNSALYQVDTIGSNVIACKTRVGGVLRGMETNLNLTDAIEKLAKGEARKGRS